MIWKVGEPIRITSQDLKPADNADVTRMFIAAIEKAISKRKKEIEALPDEEQTPSK